MNQWAKDILAELPSEEALKVPKPGGEKKSKYMSRCMRDAYMKRKFPRIDQRVAVCLTTWDDR